MAKRFAGIFALVAFFAACGRGLLSGSPFDSAVWQACVSLWVFGVLGLVFGALAERAVAESLLAKRTVQANETAGTKVARPPKREASAPKLAP